MSVSSVPAGKASREAVTRLRFGVCGLREVVCGLCLGVFGFFLASCGLCLDVFGLFLAMCGLCVVVCGLCVLVCGLSLLLEPAGACGPLTLPQGLKVSLDPTLSQSEQKDEGAEEMELDHLIFLMTSE